MTMTERRMINRLDTLTERERTILDHLQDGLPAVDIATVEYITVATTRSHIRSILAKLGVNSQLAAVAKANRRDRCENCTAVAS